MDLSRASISQIKELIDGAGARRLGRISQLLRNDSRAGVHELLARTKRRSDWYKKEDARLRVLTKYESQLAGQGFRLIAGADEAGRGALAGPLVAAAVILKPKEKIVGINDSKLLPPSRRESLFETIKEKAVAWAVVEISHLEIDEAGIQRANLNALRLATQKLEPQPDFVIIDCFKVDCGIPSLPLVKGDTLSQTVAAASILAKVHRDRIMQAENDRFPSYGFKMNKGYSSSQHLEALSGCGPCELHRRSFSPVELALSNQMVLGLD